MNRRHALFAGASTAFAGKTLAADSEAINALAEHFDTLHQDILNLQEQIFPDTPGQSAQSLAYEQLATCSNLVGALTSEFDATTRLLRVARLVTEPTARVVAKPYLESQRTRLVGRLNRTAAFLEKNLHRVRHSKVSAIYLRTRDLIRQSLPVAERIELPW